MGRRHGQRGLSLLEVLITLMLLTTTMVAFAAVYPAAFKLNRRTSRVVQAAELAGAISEELRTLPFNRPNSSTAGGIFVQDFLSGWDPADPKYLNRFPRTELPAPYTLKSRTGQVGVRVTGDDPFTYADILITIFWMENVNDQMIEKSFSIHTSRSGNR